MSIGFLASAFVRRPRARLAENEGPDEASIPDFIEIRDFSFAYPRKPALHSVTLAIPERRVTSLVGPSGCGKTTLLRCINRLGDLESGCRRSGDILLAGRSVFEPGLRLMNLRRSVGMVFQKSNPFPMSIRENIALGVRLGGSPRRSEVAARVEESLVQAALWDEVKDRLDQSAFALSGGQMQRLCIARALACEPQVLLMDEPCSSLDPVTTAQIEELIRSLSARFTIVLVTHNLQQAARCSDRMAVFFGGRLVEHGETGRIFTQPADPRTLDYIMGTLW